MSRLTRRGYLHTYIKTVCMQRTPITQITPIEGNNSTNKPKPCSILVNPSEYTFKSNILLNLNLFFVCM